MKKISDKPFVAADILKQFDKKFAIDENPKSSFIDELRAAGFKQVPATSEIGKIIRIEAPDDKPGKKSGWYVYYEVPNEQQAGTFVGIGVYGSWKGNPERVVWTSKSRDVMSPVESLQIEVHIKEQQAVQARALRERQETAADRAIDIWANAASAPLGHPYIVAKEIKPYGVRVSRGSIIVPVMDGSDMTSLQFIGIDGDKKFLSGGKVKGCHFLIEGSKTRVFITEGFATAATIHEATGATVYASFNCNNLMGVASYVKDEHPTAEIIIAGDDDRWTTGNPGRTKAELVAGTQAIFPIFTDNSAGKPTDFNDLHVREGIDVVREQLSNEKRRSEIGATSTETISDQKVKKDEKRPCKENVSLKGSKQPTALTFDECMEAAKGLSEDSLPDDISKVLEAAVKVKPNPIERRQILATIKTQTKMPLSDLKEGFTELIKEKAGSPTDLAHDVAKRTLRSFYAGGSHLVRAMDRSFWKYNWKHWERITEEQVQKKILSIVESTVDPEDGGYAGLVKAALVLIISMQAAEGDVLRLTEEPPSVINCQNGELWIAPDGAVELRPHKFNSYLIYVLDAKYDPNASCPKFDQALKDIFANSTDTPDMVRHIEEFIGYAIQPRRNIPSWFMLQGRGRNGKTKLVETIERLINKGAIYSDRLANVEKDKFAVGAIAGKLLLLDDDVDTGTVLPDGFMKKSSERKLMTGQLKFKDSFEFICVALIVVLANNLPLSADLSYGNRRRAQVIPFARTFTDEDADDALFPYIWENEMSGILNRAIEGLGRLRQRGRFKPPIDCQAAMTNWLMQANPLVAFIDEKCASEVGATTPGEAFYAEYQMWAETAGVRSIPSRTMTYANLENLGYEMRRHSSGRVVNVLRLNGHHYNIEGE